MLLISALCGVACNFFCKNSIILILFAYLCVNVMRIFKPKNYYYEKTFLSFACIAIGICIM